MTTPNKSVCCVLLVCTALSAVGKLIGPDLINAVLPAVTGLTTHPKDLVRKKAVMALHRFQQLDPHHEGPLAGADLDKYYRQALCDKVPAEPQPLGRVWPFYNVGEKGHESMLCMVQDPSVMSAALCALLEVVTVDPKPYKNLIPSFISILKQVKFSRHHCRNKTSLQKQRLEKHYRMLC